MKTINDSKKHYFLLHSSLKYGAISEGDTISKDEFDFTTGSNKATKENLIGNYVWLIYGEKSKTMRYYFIKRVLVTKIEPKTPNIKKIRGYGKVVYSNSQQKKIEITEKKWWKNYKNRNFNKIKDFQVINGLLEICPI